MSVCLIDTSILCEILEVPNLCKDSDTVLTQMERKIKRKESLLLPMSSIVEAGNHIGQNGDGRQRRKTAQKFVELIGAAIRGETPFTPTPFFEPEKLLDWLDMFPDWVKMESGLADLTIFKEYERQCELNPSRSVYIWSSDHHLSSYRRDP